MVLSVWTFSGVSVGMSVELFIGSNIFLSGDTYVMQPVSILSSFTFAKYIADKKEVKDRYCTCPLCFVLLAEDGFGLALDLELGYLICILLDDVIV